MRKKDDPLEMEDLEEPVEKEMTDKDIELNMPKVIGNIFKAVFDDERWTWMGLARLFVMRFKKGDLEELITCIQIEQDKRRKK